MTCHKTLPGIPDSHPELGYAACRGFLDAYPDTLAARMADDWFGGWYVIDPPGAAGATAGGQPRRAPVR